MIRLGLRLTIGSGREALVRLIITAAAVAIGVGMLLLTLASVNAVTSQNERYSWLNAGFADGSPGVPRPPAVTPGGADRPVWFRLRGDRFEGRLIGRVEIAATGPHPVLPPGLTALPAAGQFAASPAMTALLRSAPAAELGDRYPGRQVATIAPPGLPSPDSLVIVIGERADVLSRAPDASEVWNFAVGSPGGCGCYEAGINAAGIDLILAVTAGALLFPVLVFISSATRLAAARREQRFAAMRLVGATPRQVAVVASVESSVAAVLGVLGGFALFWALRPAAAGIPLTGGRFYISDLTLVAGDIAGVAIGVPVAAVITARLSLRRTIVSPLGVTRRSTPRPPRARRLIPLGVGILELCYFLLVGRPATSGEQIFAYLGGVLVVMTGLIVAGPWLTMTAARAAAARTSRPAVLLAGRRLADSPQTAFRAISGVILALFVATVAVSIIGAIDANEGAPTGAPYYRSTLVDDFRGPVGPHGLPGLDPRLADDLRTVPGVTAVVAVRATRQSGDPRLGPPLAWMSCADLDRVAWLGHCSPGAHTATISPDYDQYRPADRTEQGRRRWPAGPSSVRVLSTQRVESLIVTTSGSTSALERARTLLDLAYPQESDPPTTLAENLAAHTQEISGLQRLADVVIIASLPIAGCSLAVSVAGGLADRRRPFSLLRLAGAPLGILRRVVACEGAVPLFVGAVVSTAAAFLTADLFLESQLGYAIVLPGPGYALVVVVGLLVSLLVIASTFQLLARLTDPETARND